ncbi:glucokinase [Robertmurraya siralis]|uniref:Glucokinase n=1 Tax=Robertmurraya siralis TaxID=77777 RepID=A0A919WEM2_9BACI|nr:ROK family glucokinase [Robertmurraya siralis]PAE21808.1 glucokinase [Bacillus sp. 7504-2]GIN60475.1 glucokinase [Robertmurraya siralis]
MKKWVAGVDLGGTSIKIAFIDTLGTIISKWQIPTDNREKGKNITIDIARTIEEKLTELGQSKEILEGIGMGAPGPVDYVNGILYNTVNLAWEDHYPLRDKLEKELSLPVYIENDANCAALGEMWKGAGAGAKDLVCVTLGTGVGGGIITNGEIVQGVSGSAGEIGHITSVSRNGAPCNCGKKGCLETVASATGIVRLATEKLEKERDNEGKLMKIFKANGKIAAKDVFDCGREGDELSLEVVEEVAYHLGLALANLGNTLNPEKIVIGGGVSKAGNILLDRVQAYFNEFAFSRVKESTTISIATLENDAGILGAGWLVVNRM